MSETSASMEAAATYRKSLWLAAGAVAGSLAAMAVAWSGGLWLLPLVFVLIAASWRASSGTGSQAQVPVLALTATATIIGLFAVVSSGGLGVAFRTSAPTYQPGDRVELQLRGGIFGAGYNLCGATLVALTGEAVETVSRDGAGFCTAELRAVPPLFGASHTVTLPEDLAPGQYHYVDTVEVRGHRRAVATPIFAVESVARAAVGPRVDVAED